MYLSATEGCKCKLAFMARSILHSPRGCERDKDNACFLDALSKKALEILMDSALVLFHLKNPAAIYGGKVARLRFHITQG